MSDPKPPTLKYDAHPAWQPLPPLPAATLQQLGHTVEPQQPTVQPLYSRQDLETLASGKISAVFGPLFAQQDDFVKQVRMPMPPLLLADRVMKLEGEPGSMSRGLICTETDVRDDSWYVHDNHMPIGIMIESGQADLLIISWMGIDFQLKGQRVYRLLGADVVFHGELPKVGDTLNYEIYLDGIAKLGDIYLMFFHYDCRVNGELRITLRHGQAGFFSPEELSGSQGVLWDANTATFTANPRLDPPKVLTTYRRFSSQQLAAFSNGDTYGCFGPGFEAAQHLRYAPRIAADRMRLIDEVTDFDPNGGPAGRGYLRATLAISPDDWFFKAHFKNDPCMPGTLMFQGGVHAISFYLAALGYTLDKDGWYFGPLSDEEIASRCRGECHPASQQVVYEIFVDEIIAGPYPTVIVDLLCSVDGLKALHAHRLGIRLLPQ